MRLLLLCLLLLLFLECVSSKRKPKPKSKPKGKTKPKPKGEPVRPTIVKKPSLAIFKKYTKKPKGGRCWWGMTRTDCAQCKKGGVQCGYPMHKFCFKNTPGMGCPGVPNHKYTLSTRGYPCYWDYTNLGCAWCSEGNHQCGPGEKDEFHPDSKIGNVCMMGKDSTYCDQGVRQSARSGVLTPFPFDLRQHRRCTQQVRATHRR